MQNIKDSTEIKLHSLADVAVDCWRLNRWISSKGADESLTVPKHVLRRILKFLDECAVTTVDLTGQPFDPGLAAEVVDVVNDPALVQEAGIISETIAPIVMWNGTAIKHAQVIVCQNSSSALLVANEDKKS